MTDREFKVQVIETREQWESGVSSRLELGGDGLSLFLSPSFDSWFLEKDWTSVAGDIVVDECGQTYWTALDAAMPKSKRIWKLLRLNPTTHHVEQVLNFGDCISIEPRELWLTPDFLWIFDHGDADKKTGLFTGRVLALSRDNLQIIQEFVLERLIDIDFDTEGSFFYALVSEDGTPQICRYSTCSRSGPQEDCFTLTKTTKPVAVAVGKEGNVYVVDAGDKDHNAKLVRVKWPQKDEIVLGSSERDILYNIQPSAMQVDQRGVIFVATNEPARVHMFDADGSCLGKLELPDEIQLVSGIGFDRQGNLYLATNRGVAKFMLTKNAIGREGIFYSRTLDNGQTESFWHLIALRGRLPSKTSIEVYYHASDSVALKNAFDRVVQANESVEEQAKQIENLFTGSWVGPETFKGTNVTTKESSLSKSKADDETSLQLIINPNKGRFLWLKLKLTTFDQKKRPSIRSVRIYYPRLSYLRYLPPLYREDPVSAAFLERFLSIFETGFEGLDQEIDQLFSYFDPKLTPKKFLPWLASWINLSLDEDLPEARVRRFLSRAPYLYSRKGTPQALIEFMEIYTGKPVYLTEYSRALKPMLLRRDKEWVLGSGVVLLGSGPRGMNVGNTTVVGYSAVRDRVSDIDEPFLPFSRRFQMFVDMERSEFEKRKMTLERIVKEQAPAHTTCRLRIFGDERTIGNAVLGTSAVAHGPQPYRVGMTQLGEGSAFAKGVPTLRLERGAWVGSSHRV